MSNSRARFSTLSLLFACVVSGLAFAQTQVVMLGTGTPVPDGDRAGSGVAILTGGEAYLFDAGGGIVQRAAQAKDRLGIEALNPARIKYLFFTHLHSDHTLDYPELAATLWWRRTEKLKAWGPAGLEAMTQGMYKMMETDIKIRTTGTQPVEHPDHYQVEVTEMEAGTVFRKPGVHIEAFEVNHGNIKPAYGYRVRTPDKTIVISGDTAYSDKLVEMAKGADILIHEVISEAGIARLPGYWQRFHSSSHTTTRELAKIANKTLPRLLVLYHILFLGAPEASVVDEIARHYGGEVVLANDLDVF